MKQLIVTVKTFYGDTSSYNFTIDCDDPNSIANFYRFSHICLLDCTDKFPCPENWEIDDWMNEAKVTIEVFDI